VIHRLQESLKRNSNPHLSDKLAPNTSFLLSCRSFLYFYKEILILL